MYYALLANVISILSIALKQSGLIEKEDIEIIWNESIEKTPKKREFKTLENIYEGRKK